MDKEAIIAAFTDFISGTPELSECAILFAASPDGNEIVAVCGGHHMLSPVYDAMTMRLVYNVVSQREDFYHSEHIDMEIDRGHDHGTEQ